MSTITRRGGNYAALVFSLFIVSAIGLGACGGDGTEDETRPIATERCNPAGQAPAQVPGVEADDEADDVSCEPGKQAKTCKSAGKTCKSSNPTACCSNACLCPLGAKKCTCG